MAHALLGKNIAMLCRRGAGAAIQLEAALGVLLQQSGGGFAPVSLQADYDRSLSTRSHHRHHGGCVHSLGACAGTPHHHRHFHATTASAAQNKDYYDVLGVPRDAKDGDIKKAYYKLAKQFHPDTNKGDEAAARKFQEVSRAYDTLRDPQKRQQYDALGADGYERMAEGGGGGGPWGGQGQGGGFDQAQHFEDIFAQFFGGGGGGFQRGGSFRGGFSGFEGFSAKGPDLQARIRVPFMDAVRGTRLNLNLGSMGGSKGGGVEVDIPAGIDHGGVIKVPGKGGAPPRQFEGAGEPGDLLLQVEVEPSPIFERAGYDVVVPRTIDFLDAILGGTIRVPTLEGSAEVSVRPGTQPGNRLKMHGYGIPHVHQPGRKGDQYVLINVRLPREHELNAEQKRLLEAFRDEERQKKKQAA